MGLNKSQKQQLIKEDSTAIIDRRRRLVARELLRGLTQREIHDKMTALVKNPETGQPYSLGTINSDIKFLRRGWKKEASRDMDIHQARIYAELQEVKRAAWGAKAYAVVIKAIEKEMDMFGLNAKNINLHSTAPPQPVFNFIGIVDNGGLEDDAGVDPEE